MLHTISLVIYKLFLVWDIILIAQDFICPKIAKNHGINRHGSSALFFQISRSTVFPKAASALGCSLLTFEAVVVRVSPPET